MSTYFNFVLNVCIFFYTFFRLCGVDLQSQTAYELAAKGPIRPMDSKTPVIYGVKCVHFDPPDFTLGNEIKIDVLMSYNLFPFFRNPMYQ